MMSNYSRANAYYLPLLRFGYNVLLSLSLSCECLQVYAVINALMSSSISARGGKEVGKSSGGSEYRVGLNFNVLAVSYSRSGVAG